MTCVYGLYDHPVAAQRAFNALQRAGINSREITVMSTEPFEAFDFARRDHSLILFRLAAIGGVLGLIVGVLLTVGTERAWPLVTGGMPIVAWWPNLIVIFELTMLGAILTTVISLLVAGRLPTWKRSIYDPAVSDGKILVGVHVSGDAEPIRRALDSAQPFAVKSGDFVV
jgi:hypothetical protein